MKKYAVCGLSNRGIAQYILPLAGKKEYPELGNYSMYGKTVAILDIDQNRIKHFNHNQGFSFPAYKETEFDKMVKETQPDAIIVTCPDGFHAEYIVKGLQSGLDVITEKPMTITAQQSMAVIKAERESKGSLFVTFNYRYAPLHKQIKRMINDDLVGKITSIDLSYMLDTYHGSSFFRRWNRERETAGGLTITKASHHFDLVNWFLDDIPQEVFAFGARNFFGSESPYKPGGELTIEEQKKKCPYFKRWNDPSGNLPLDDHLSTIFDLPYEKQYPKELYIYDKEIEIEDTISAVIRYKNGAMMCYSLNASTPWEGYTLAINGLKGRLEINHYTAPSRCPFPAPEHETITYLPMFGERQVFDVQHVEGGHGGADIMIKNDIFIGVSEESTELNICAGAKAGAYASVIGEAIWRSAQTSKPMIIDNLLKAKE